MDIAISIQNDIVSVLLKDKKKEVDMRNFQLDNNLSEKFLPAIDKILQRNKLRPDDLEKACLSAEVPDSYTTYRIAKAVVDAINWGKGR